MSDTMPERVLPLWDEVEYHEPMDGRPPYWAVFDLGSVIGVKSTRYVRGDRLLAAEARVLELEERVGTLTEIRNEVVEKVVALRADLKALLPLAAKGWGELVGTEYEDSPEGIAAHAILEREGT